MAKERSHSIPDVDITTQIGIIDPLLDRIGGIEGVMTQEIFVVGTFARKTYSIKENTTIDLCIPVRDEAAIKKILEALAGIPWPQKNKGYMMELGIGWGWLGVMPVLPSTIKNYYLLMDSLTGEVVLTNPIMHVNYLKNMGRNFLVKQLKSDLAAEEIPFNGFRLELLIHKVLKGFGGSDEEAYRRFMQYIVEHLSELVFRDPANDENLLSIALNPEYLERLRLFAIRALKNL